MGTFKELYFFPDKTKRDLSAMGTFKELYFLHDIIKTADTLSNKW